jgi:cytochrome c oxidase subunit I+III
MRETIATSPMSGRAALPDGAAGDSWLPLLGAAGTAAFFLLLTMKLTVLAWIGGIVAIVSVCWAGCGDRTGRPPGKARSRRVSRTTWCCRSAP